PPDQRRPSRRRSGNGEAIFPILGPGEDRSGACCGEGQSNGAYAKSGGSYFGEINRPTVLAPQYGAVTRVVRPANARLREFVVVHRGVRGDRGLSRADCEATRPDALRVDGEAGGCHRKKQAN